MANTLTPFIRTIYDAQRKVSRELVGMISAVSKDAKAEEVGIDQVIQSPVVPVGEVRDIVPGNVTPTGNDRNVGSVSIVMNKQRVYSFNISGEETKSLEAGGMMSEINRQSFENAFRELGNEIERDLCALHVNASRAYGSVGVAPFATKDDLSDISQLGRILNDNGAPASGRSLILNTAALAALQGLQPSVFRVNENGDPVGRRMGAVGMLFNFDIGETGGFVEHIHGAGSGYISNSTSAQEIGTEDVTVDTGTGEIKVGDIITFTGDDNKYVSQSAGDGLRTIKLQDPGLRHSLANDVAMSNEGDYTPSLAFSRDAFHLACRVPAVPAGGDIAADRQMIMDPHSGLVYEVSLYQQYRQVSIEIGICWGVATLNPRHAAILLG